MSEYYLCSRGKENQIHPILIGKFGNNPFSD